MRLLACAALLLLAGCTSPSAVPAAADAMPDADLAHEAGASAAVPGSSPVVAVAHENVTLDVLASAWMTSVALPSPTWDATQDLALPRPVLTVFVEVACVKTAGTTSGDPGFSAQVHVERPDGDTLISSYGGGVDGCRAGHAFPAEDLGAGRLSFVAVSLSAPFVAVQASYDVQLAVSLLATAQVPEGYTALP